MPRLKCAVWLVAAGLVVGSGCKSVPAPAVNTPAPPPPAPLDTRVSWILRLEQQRMLRDDDAESPAPPAVGGQLKPARTPDLVALLNDTDARVRRRAALAIGRVGRSEGVAPLSAALSDQEEDVRAAAAFALGLIGAKAAVEPLETALKDPSAQVQGRAADALGLVGDASAARSIADAASGCAAILAPLEPDDEALPKSGEIERCRLAIDALARLKQYEPLAKVVLDARGDPVSRWWPVAFGLQHVGDTRAAPALAALASTPGTYTAAFALRGLGELKDARGATAAKAAATRASADIRLRVAAVRALAQIGGPGTLETLLSLARDRSGPKNLALEATTAIGVLGDPRGFDPLLDLFTGAPPSMRAALLTATAKLNPENFLLVVSSLPADSDWSVRAALAPALETLPPDEARAELIELAADKDVRVRAPALRALAKVGAPDLAQRLFDALDAEDFVVRATAAELIGQTHPDGGADHLIAAYARAEADAAYAARASALEALAKYGADQAKAVLHRGLADKAWPVRWRAAELLHGLGEAGAAPEVPAPLREPSSYFESPELLHPSFSPHAFLETRAGTIEIELNLIDAPVASKTFVDLARSGFFNGVAIHRVVPNFVVQGGDPRGDGEGGPGFTIMDELSTQPYVRGTVGMALDWRDTGGSQFFITVSPQPQLEGKYSVFGRVVQGDAVLDTLSQWDVIDRVRIWDGVSQQ